MKIFVVNNFSPKEKIGGSEIQCWLIAKYLAAMGHQTIYIALKTFSDKTQEYIDRVNVRYISHKKDGKLRTLVNFYKFFKKEKPDICYIRFFRYLFFLAKICKFLKIPVVFNTSHINDCKPILEKIKFCFNPFKFLQSIRAVIQRRFNSSILKKVTVITINKYHAKLLKEQYNIEATPIYNSMEDNYDRNQAEKQKQVVWVNNIKERKRPELFIKLADEFRGGNYKFLMIGNFQNNIEFYKNLIKECEDTNSNFKYLGGKTPEEVDKILAESQIMANTCEPEGFGNNFIQAWFNKCPTITLSFDPDEIIETNKIGFFSRNFEQMVKDLRILMNDKQLREAIGEKARKYALENHSISANIKKYEEKFKQALYDKKNK